MTDQYVMTKLDEPYLVRDGEPASMARRGVRMEYHEIPPRDVRRMTYSVNRGKQLWGTLVSKLSNGDTDSIIAAFADMQEVLRAMATAYEIREEDILNAVERKRRDNGSYTAFNVVVSIGRKVPQ